mmetsp:Transcript_12308/g.51774  ORF Transcript_12308/g.51774 Transcript_12308/m.51774 type:complete len:217 (-) Transcript_12308:193-843(-)
MGSSVRPRRGPAPQVRRRPIRPEGQGVRRVHGTFSDAPVPLLAGFFKGARRVRARVRRAGARGERKRVAHARSHPARGRSHGRTSRRRRGSPSRRLSQAAAHRQRGCVLLAGPGEPRRARRAAEPARGAPRVRGAADGAQPTVQGADHRDQGDDVVGVVGRRPDAPTGSIRRGIQPGDSTRSRPARTREGAQGLPSAAVDERGDAAVGARRGANGS